LGTRICRLCTCGRQQGLRSLPEAAARAAGSCCPVQLAAARV